MRGNTASVLVAGISSAFGVTLLAVTNVLSEIISNNDVTGSSSFVRVLLQLVAIVFIVIAVYVGAVVTSNTFATIIAGRTRTIALYRLIGSTAAAQRRAVATDGLLVGLVGAAIGALIGVGLTALFVAISLATGFIPSGRYDWLQPVLVVPAVIVVLTTWAASWVGSRRVLTVSPVEATGAAVSESQDEAAGHRSRNVFALVLVIMGFVLLVLSVFVGLINPAAVLIGVLGGILSFTGLILGSTKVMPLVLRLTGRLFGSTPTARLAAENAVRYPERSSRMTIGLVIGVTLITMFAVAIDSLQHMIRLLQQAQPAVYQGTDNALDLVVAVVSILIGFSAVIAAVGMVNNLSLSVLQRTREIGLLRALGFTAKQVRRMILAESAQLTIAAVILGFVLGTFYGWVGAQSLLGVANGLPGFVPPSIPVPLLIIVAVASLGLIVVASITPSRRATKILPVEALAME